MRVELRDVTDRDEARDLDTERGERVAVAPAVVPQGVAPEKLEQLGTEPARARLHLLEVVEDGVFGQRQSVAWQQVGAEDDVPAAGEPPFGREQRVVAQRRECRMQGLRDLGERRRVRVARRRHHRHRDFIKRSGRPGSR